MAYTASTHGWAEMHAKLHSWTSNNHRNTERGPCRASGPKWQRRNKLHSRRPLNDKRLHSKHMPLYMEPTDKTQRVMNRRAVGTRYLSPRSKIWKNKKTLITRDRFTHAPSKRSKTRNYLSCPWQVMQTRRLTTSFALPRPEQY